MLANSPYSDSDESISSGSSGVSGVSKQINIYKARFLWSTYHTCVKANTCKMTR